MHVKLTEKQAAGVKFALDHMRDECRLNAAEVWDSFRYTLEDCPILCGRRLEFDASSPNLWAALCDLEYRLTEQLPHMSEHEGNARAARAWFTAGVSTMRKIKAALGE